MFIIIEKETQKASIYFEKSQVLDIIQVSRPTLLKYFKLGKFENDNYIVYKASFVQKRSKRGDLKGKNLPKRT